MRVVIGTVIIGLMLAALFCLVAPAYAVIFIGGVEAAPECTTSNDSELYAFAPAADQWLNAEISATKFEVTTQMTITEYTTNVCDQGADSGTLQASLWSHNAGSDQPSALISGTEDTIAASTLPNCDTPGTSTVTLGTPYVDLDTGIYWFVTAEASGSNLKHYYDAFESGKRGCLSNDSGASWSCGTRWSEGAVFGCE